tara:strand:- start:20015 stop:20239 length:225 start_codon:yes stop_codon:yes gene_type:complete
LEEANESGYAPQRGISAAKGEFSARRMNDSLLLNVGCHAVLQTLAKGRPKLVIKEDAQAPPSAFHSKRWCGDFL